MTSLLMLDDQTYTIEAMAEIAQSMKIDVVKEESIFSFKATAERWVTERRSFATAIDMNLRNVTDLDMEHIGATREEIGNGEAAGLVVARHMFFNGADEATGSVLSHVPIAMISGDDLKPSARKELERITRSRKAETRFVPKPDNPARPIPRGASWEGFLKNAISALAGGQVDVSEEAAILSDVRKLLKLNDGEVARLLGFIDASVDVETLLSQGTKPASRDWSDRLHHVFDAFVELLAIYSKSDARRWMNASLDILDGQSPREKLLGGTMLDVLTVKQLAFELGRPGA